MYDGIDRRAAKTINGLTSQYLYDRQNPTQELDSNKTPTADLITGLHIDEYLQRTDTAGSRSFLSDILGSTLALADPSGAIQTSYTYEPFGNVTLAGAASASSYQFTGRENDGNGLYYYRARYYAPSLQRFIAKTQSTLPAGRIYMLTSSITRWPILIRLDFRVYQPQIRRPIRHRRQPLSQPRTSLSLSAGSLRNLEIASCAQGRPL